VGLQGKMYLVSIFGFYFSVRTVVHAVKFQVLHTVAQISAKCSVFFVSCYAIFLWLPIKFKWEKIKRPSVLWFLSWVRIQQEGKVKSKFTLHTLCRCLALLSTQQHTSS